LERFLFEDLAGKWELKKAEPASIEAVARKRAKMAASRVKKRLARKLARIAETEEIIEVD